MAGLTIASRRPLTIEEYLLEKYAIYNNESGRWETRETAKKNPLRLSLYADCMHVLDNSIILDSIAFDMIRSVSMKDDIFIILHERKKAHYRIKIKFISYRRKSTLFVRYLSKYCRVEDCNETPDGERRFPVEKTMIEMFKEEMKRNPDFSAETFPDDYPVEDFLKICILDPEFENFVDRMDRAFKKTFADENSQFIS